MCLSPFTSLISEGENMGIITQEIEVELNSNNVKYFEDLGYNIPRRRDNKGRINYIRGQTIKVNPNDLKDKSNEKIDVQCDNEKCKKTIKNIKWANYKKSIKKFGAYYCLDCAMKLYGRDKILSTKLSKTKSFEQWCLDNYQEDVLGMWDYELNNCKPSEICFSTPKKYYFKCPNNLHSSEIKRISDYTNINKGNIKCKQCNSFAQWGIDNICSDFLEKYWDYEKNVINPWDIASKSNSKVWIKCQEKDYHENYKTTPFYFTSGRRCPTCNQSKGEKVIKDNLDLKNFYYIPQKTFEGLLGIGKGLLSYDYFLPHYNLLIEYQGEYHDGTARNQTEKQFKKQQEHDKRKKEYAQKHNIKLLEIWYWDFDRIEEILEKELNLLKI
jgi:hypothetical protein